MLASVQSLIDRPYRTSDLDSLVEIEKQAGDAKWSRKIIIQCIKQLERDTRIIVSGENESEPVGFYAVEHGDQTLYICNIAVPKNWRRKGVASFCLDSIEAMARSLKYTQIALDVQEENLAAQLLYKKAGYKAVEICRRHYGSQDGYHMVKEL